MGARKTILVVDDNTVNLATVEKSLKAKYDIVPMISGKRALRYLYCQRVDLILLDVEMPEMSGVETLEEIRKLETTADTPVIFLTANKDKQTVLDGFRLKIMDYITKPFDVENLVNRVEHTLKRSGALPFEKKEIYQIISTIVNDIDKTDYKAAISRLSEAVNYKTDSEVIGRLSLALTKLSSGDIEGGSAIVRRVHKMLEMELGPDANDEQRLTKDELKAHLNDIIDSLDNFQTKEAAAKCKELQKYKIPKYIIDSMSKCVEYIANYDDEEAEKLVQSILTQIG